MQKLALRQLNLHGDSADTYCNVVCGLLTLSYFASMLVQRLQSCAALLFSSSLIGNLQPATVPTSSSSFPGSLTMDILIESSSSPASEAHYHFETSS
jgi:hypothetical protein